MLALGERFLGGCLGRSSCFNERPEVWCCCQPTLSGTKTRHLTFPAHADQVPSYVPSVCRGDGPQGCWPTAATGHDRIFTQPQFKKREWMEKIQLKKKKEKHPNLMCWYLIWCPTKCKVAGSTASATEMEEIFVLCTAVRGWRGWWGSGGDCGVT